MKPLHTATFRDPHPPHPPGGCLFNSAEVLETFCGRRSGSMRLAGYPTANSSPEFLERVSNVVPDLFTTCGSEQNAECDADADAHEQRCCRAESRTILPGHDPRGSPEAPARGCHMRPWLCRMPSGSASEDSIMARPTLPRH